MLRVVLVNFLMFLLPFLIYAAIALATGKRKIGEGFWSDAPVKWLFVAGLGLMLIAVGALISFSGGGPGGSYEPPHMENGVIKPGRIN
ncbi:MAG: DUF6111 family protein [Pseudomonadota bacterium]|nr:DUF6111 family protein [Pseudomonadota bacterium]